MCSHSTHRLFCPLFQKWRPARSSARRVGELPFLFCQAFFFVAILPKKKASQRRTSLRYQDFLAAFFAKRGAKKANKETPIFRSSRWASAFEKAEQNNRAKRVRTFFHTNQGLPKREALKFFNYSASTASSTTSATSATSSATSSTGASSIRSRIERLIFCFSLSISIIFASTT